MERSSVNISGVLMDSVEDLAWPEHTLRSADSRVDEYFGALMSLILLVVAAEG